MQRRRLEQDRRSEQDVDRLSRSTKQEIKQDVESSLLARALPNPKLFECAWNLETEGSWNPGHPRLENLKCPPPTVAWGRNTRPAALGRGRRQNRILYLC